MYEGLKEFGLSENEINTYVELLKAGVSTANRVAKLTGIKRSTTYDNLNLLINKGLVSSIIREKVTYYESIDPKKIVRLMDEKKDKLIKIVTELSALKESNKEQSGVSFFEGKRGVITILNDILDEKKEFWFYGSRKQAMIALQAYPDNFVLKRAEAGLNLKAVMSEDDRGDPAMNDKKVYALSKIKFLKDLNQVSTNVFLYGDKVAFMTSGENVVGIIIKNKEIVEQQRTIFGLLWKVAKK
ncbi:hypothetical protein J4216_00930 [Candidatus Woesearchaeota archaeon]|nr:hypothetical protein [Candidatus Woesearchaeota archaeon]